MDIQVSILNSFVLEFREAVSVFDTMSFKNLQNNMNSTKLNFTKKINPNLYIKYIKQSLENLDSISADLLFLDEFFTKAYPSVALCEKNIAMPVRNKENIQKFRPEYLSSIPFDLNNDIKDIMSGKLDIDKIKSRPSYEVKMKKQVAKTDIIVDDPKELMIVSTPTIVQVDNIYIQNNIIPFIRSYEQNIKELKVVINNTINIINISYSNMLNTINAVEKTLNNTPNISGKIMNTLTYHVYNMMKIYMKMCAYIVGLLIRKISYYSFNMSSCIELYNNIYRYFPEMEQILHESVMDGKLHDITDEAIVSSIINNEPSIVSTHIQHVVGMKKMQLASLISMKMNKRLNFLNMEIDNTCQYDMRSYIATSKAIEQLKNDIKTFELQVKDPNMVIDDILMNSRLEESIVSRFSNILANIPNIDFYTVQSKYTGDDNNVLFISLYNEISNYENNFARIVDICNKVYKYLESIQNEYENNNDSIDNNRYEEIKSSIEIIIKNYKEFILQVAKKYLERLDQLTDLFTDIEINTDMKFSSDMPTNYSLENALEEYYEIEVREAAIFEKLLAEYTKEKFKRQKGISIVYEEADNSTNANNSSGNETQNENKSSTPEVKTDAQQQHENKSNTSNSPSKPSDNKDKKSLVQKFKDFWQKLVEAFRGKSAKLCSKNNEWLNSVKDDISGLNFENTNITIAPYENATMEKITADISAAVTTINALNASNLPAEFKESSNREKAIGYVFKTIPASIGKKGTADSFTFRVKHFFTYGSGNDESLKSYTGNDAQTKVQNMINYCLTYDKTYKTVSRKLQELVDSAAAKQTDIISKHGSVVNESVLFEANEPTVSQNGDKISSTNNEDKTNYGATVITSIVREYSASVLTIVEKKYLDYIKVLQKLSPEHTVQNSTTDGEDNKKDKKEKKTENQENK